MLGWDSTKSQIETGHFNLLHYDIFIFFSILQWKMSLLAK